MRSPGRSLTIPPPRFWALFVPNRSRSWNRGGGAGGGDEEEGRPEQGIGWTYGSPACAAVISGVLAGVVHGRPTLDVPGASEAMIRAARKITRPGTGGGGPCQVTSQVVVRFLSSGLSLPCGNARVSASEVGNTVGGRAPRRIDTAAEDGGDLCVGQASQVVIGDGLLLSRG